jgi:hypothetical protein
MALFAPIPRAMMRMATEVKPGLFSKCLIANFRSCRNLDMTRPSGGCREEQIGGHPAIQQTLLFQRTVQKKETTGVRSRKWVSANEQDAVVSPNFIQEPEVPERARIRG